jgi:hypothetical protein
MGGTPDPATAHHFGLSLAVGAFSGGDAQLAIGAPGIAVGGEDYAGGVYVTAIAPGDLTLSSIQLVTRATPGVEGGVTGNSQFGYALAAGDFDEDGRDDLAIGCPYDDVSTFDDAGSVTVLTGSETGLFGGTLLLHEDVTDVPDAAEASDYFGEELAAADYDGDGDADLVIGAHGETIGGIPTAGGLLVLEGDAGGPFDLAQSHWLDKSLAAIAGSPGSNDTFGSALGN